MARVDKTWSVELGQSENQALAAPSCPVPQQTGRGLLGAMACSRLAWQLPGIRKVTRISSCHSAPGKILLNVDKGHLYEAWQRLCHGMKWPEPQQTQWFPPSVWSTSALVPVKDSLGWGEAGKDTDRKFFLLHPKSLCCS